MSAALRTSFKPDVCNSKTRENSQWQTETTQLHEHKHPQTHSLDLSHRNTTFDNTSVVTSQMTQQRAVSLHHSTDGPGLTSLWDTVCTTHGAASTPNEERDQTKTLSDVSAYIKHSMRHTETDRGTQVGCCFYPSQIKGTICWLCWTEYVDFIFCAPLPSGQFTVHRLYLEHM